MSREKGHRRDWIGESDQTRSSEARIRASPARDPRGRRRMAESRFHKASISQYRDPVERSENCCCVERNEHRRVTNERARGCHWTAEIQPLFSGAILSALCEGVSWRSSAGRRESSLPGRSLITQSSFDRTAPSRSTVFVVL